MPQCSSRKCFCSLAWLCETLLFSCTKLHFPATHWTCNAHTTGWEDTLMQGVPKPFLLVRSQMTPTLQPNSSLYIGDIPISSKFSINPIPKPGDPVWGRDPQLMLPGQSYTGTPHILGADLQKRVDFSAAAFRPFAPKKTQTITLSFRGAVRSDNNRASLGYVCSPRDRREHPGDLLQSSRTSGTADQLTCLCISMFRP